MREYMATMFRRILFLHPMAATVLTLGPRDVLVISVEQVISDETALRLKTHMQNILGASQEIIVLGDGLKLGVIHRPEVS